MRPILILVIAGCMLTVGSCSKFLEQYSQNQAFIQSAADLDELLIGDGYGKPVWTNQNLLDDDLEQNAAPVSDRPFDSFGFHQWQKVTNLKSDGTINSSEEDFRTFYQRIAALNTILFNIPLQMEKGEPVTVLQRISGEAHFLRALYYFLLVNTYGQPYQSSTAATDYGVPLKINPDVELKFFSRASVQEIYNQIETDLLDAENELEGMNEGSVIRANQAAAQSLLSRMYLYMENYEKAGTYADKVIGNRYRLRNMNVSAAGSPFVALESPETIYTNPFPVTSIAYYMKEAAFAAGPDNYRVSQDLVDIFEAQDLRLQFFFIKTTDGDLLTRKSGGEQSNLSDQTTIRLPELYLTKAEALAVLGRDAEATIALQELRKNRFAPENLTDITLQGEALINFIRDERRRELCFEMHRWFDLRRYGVNSKYPYSKFIRHRSYAYNSSGRFIEGYYELKPYMQDKAAYVLPIPDKEIEFNQGALTNETRPERPLQ